MVQVALKLGDQKYITLVDTMGEAPRAGTACFHPCEGAMGITESEYSCCLRMIDLLEAEKPDPGSSAHQRLEMYRIKAKFFEWEQTEPPAGSPLPFEREYSDLLDRVFTPSPAPIGEMGKPPSRPRAPANQSPRPAGTARFRR